MSGQDPNSATPAEVLASVGEQGAPGGGDPVYSNQGFAALGSALAAYAGTSYPDLLRERVLAPLGMTDTLVATDVGQLPAGRADGTTGSGLPTEPSVAAGYAPAGTGVWSTAADLAHLAQAVLEGSAPGMAALHPRSEYADSERIGLGWIVEELDGHTIVWHNGATGGFSSFVGIDPREHRAVVLLANTSTAVDEPALALLTGES